MISQLTCKEELLDFFDQLKEIKNADAMTYIVNELLQGSFYIISICEKPPSYKSNA